MTGAQPPDAAEVPERLRRRLDELLAARGTGGSADAGEMLRTAVEVTRTLLAHPDTSRETAVDLLAVDALVTRALETSAARPDGFTARCEAAMQLLASIPGNRD